MEAHGAAVHPVGQLGEVDPIGVGSDLLDGRLILDVAVDHPEPGFVLGAGLGQEQGRARLEPQSNETAPWFGGLLGIGAQSPALHEVDDERERREPQQEVLAPLVDPIEGGADRGIGGWDRRLEGGEREGPHRAEGVAAVGGGQSLGVGADLGQLGHGRVTIPSGRAAIVSRRSPTRRRSCWARSVVTSPPMRRRPCMKAAWAANRPRAMSVAVARSTVRCTFAPGAPPARTRAAPSRISTRYTTSPRSGIGHRLLDDQVGRRRRGAQLGVGAAPPRRGRRSSRPRGSAPRHPTRPGRRRDRARRGVRRRADGRLRLRGRLRPRSRA